MTIELEKSAVNCAPHGCGGGADERVSQHPCYSESAHHYFARMHLAVAPGCNIQCNYCNRKYDCANESRPGVVSERLKPEQALAKVYHVARQMKELSVIGIAGPGDALANPKRTFKTLALIKHHFPDLTFCLSTNGLQLPEYADQIVDAGVEHVTVTVNTFTLDTAKRIYPWVIIGGKKRSDDDALNTFLAAQLQGIRKLIKRGVLVKVNSILMPGVNDNELPTMSRHFKLMGIFMHNITPLIARLEHGTVFGRQGHREPSDQELEEMRTRCGDIKQMAHCRQCRADAIGKLGEDGFQDLTVTKIPEAPETPTDNGATERKKWRHEIDGLMTRQSARDVDKLETSETYTVALCSKGMGLVNQHFGHAEEFHIYKVTNENPTFVNIRKVGSHYCDGMESCGDGGDVLPRLIEAVADCDAVVSLRVGYGPHKELENAGVLPVSDIPYAPLEKAAIHAASMVAVRKKHETGQHCKEAFA